MGTVGHNIEVVAIWVENNIICTEANFDLSIRQVSSWTLHPSHQYGLRGQPSAAAGNLWSRDWQPQQPGVQVNEGVNKQCRASKACVHGLQAGQPLGGQAEDGQPLTSASDQQGKGLRNGREGQ